jgi:cytochrome P450
VTGPAPDLPDLPDLPGLADEQFHSDQYRTFAQLREQRPVTLARYYDGTPIWLVTAYEHVRPVLNDPRFSTDASRQSRVDVPAVFGIPPELSAFFERNILVVDPPAHTRLRRLIAPAFTAARVAALRPWIRDMTDRLLEGLDGEEVVDLVDRFAHPLPIAVISELLGVPPEERDGFRRWAKDLVQSEADPAGQHAELAEGARRMVEFARGLIGTKRRSGGDDLTSVLARACDEDAQLDEEELVAMVVGLLGAGYRTTSRFIANAAFALLTNPDQLTVLRDRPSLVPAAVEELLRFLTPLEAAPALRFAIQDVEVGGVIIKAGDAVQVILAAANRDPCRFAEPDRLLVDRADAGHVAFGHGLHFCPGAGLARVEAEIALLGLVTRFPGLRLAVAPERVEWYPSFSRGPISLPVRLR